LFLPTAGYNEIRDLRAWRGIRKSRCRKDSRRESAGAHEEVDLHLNAVRGTGMVDVDEVPFAQGMVIDAIL
jgi:hypothetical protein